MLIERIVDPEDPRLAGYRDLKDASLASRHGRFVVEGRRNVALLLERSGHRPESILLSERAFAALEATLRAAATGCRVWVGAQAVLDRVAGFPIHRGCLALCPRPPAQDPLELARTALAREQAPRLLVLESVMDPDNVGGIFRAGMALGARGVILCPRTGDPLYRKAIRTSMGGALVLPFARAKAWPEILESLCELGYAILALHPGAGSIGIERLEPTAWGASALLLGSEGPGLSPAALARADRCVRIEMEPGVDSLNVAMAAGIALHRLRSAGVSGVSSPEAGDGEAPAPDEGRGRR
jgi:tRNA G18 (ribose-2'-O)-methylase SpoU